MKNSLAIFTICLMVSGMIAYAAKPHAKHAAGHDHAGHDHKGHDHKGHDHKGHDHKGHDHKGHDHKGHDHKGHDHKGHDHKGHNHAGHGHTHNPENTLTSAEVKAGWLLLFDGKTTEGWMTDTGKKLTARVKNGTLAPYKSGANVLLYKKPFSDFILKCDIKMSVPECNSGVFFRINDIKNAVYSGYEAQVYHVTKKGGLHNFGAIYDLVGTSTDATKKNKGAWNTMEIRCEGPKIAVSVNGTLVAEMNQDDYPKPGIRKDGTKHKFGIAMKNLKHKGYIGFQDHGHEAFFKNIKLLPLNVKK